MELIDTAAQATPPRIAGGGVAVEANGLSKRYQRRWALANVGFVLPAGSVLLIMGHNGSGKSTLLRILATAISPDAGTARVGGHLLTEVDAVRGQVSLLSHHAYLYDSLSARQNLEVTARFLDGAGGGEIDDALDQVGLLERSHERVTGFSAGMRKRVAIARILLQKAPLLLLDEPYGSLDPQGFGFIDDLVTSAAQRGTTVIMATHHIERSAPLADYAMLLAAGRVEWSGSAAQALSRAERGAMMAEVRA